MSASDHFAHLLAEKLESQSRPGPVGTAHTIRTNPFAPAGPGGLYGDAVRAGAHAYPAVASSAWVNRPESRPIAILNQAQRDAVTALRELGAPLAHDFDAHQLKSAFRRLALDLHPDRHADAGPQRKEWLGFRFAVLCEAYRTLSGRRGA